MQLGGSAPSEAAGPTPPGTPRPLRPGSESTRPLHSASPRPGASPAAGAEGAAPRSPRPGLLRANFPIQLSPQRGERRGAGRRERGGPAGRAAYPEARPAESLHGRGRGAEPPPGPTPGTKRGGRSRLLPSWAGRGRGGAGPARPVPPSPPAAGGASAAAPLQSPPQAGRSRPGPRRPGEASSGSGAAARRSEASPQPVGQPGQGEGDRRPRCGSPSEAEHPRRVSQGGRGAATALLPPLKPGCHCRDVASPRVTSLWKDQAPRRTFPLAGVTSWDGRPPALGGGHWRSPHGRLRDGRPGGCVELGPPLGLGLTVSIHPDHSGECSHLREAVISSSEQCGVRLPQRDSNERHISYPSICSLFLHADCFRCAHVVKPVVWIYFQKLSVNKFHIYV